MSDASKILTMYGDPGRNGIITWSLGTAVVSGGQEGAEANEMALRDLKMARCLEI